MPTYPTGDRPFSVAVGDLNNDGALDIVDLNAGTGPHSYGVFLGNGDGTFTALAPTDAAGSQSTVKLSDLNGDGRLDLVTDHASFLGNGDGTFQAALPFNTGAFVSDLILGDFNSDGRPDLVASSGGSATKSIALLLGNGDGTFGAATYYNLNAGASELAAGDFNGDGGIDVAILNSSAFHVTGGQNWASPSCAIMATVLCRTAAAARTAPCNAAATSRRAISMATDMPTSSSATSSAGLRSKAESTSFWQAAPRAASAVS